MVESPSDWVKRDTETRVWHSFLKTNLSLQALLQSYDGHSFSKIQQLDCVHNQSLIVRGELSMHRNTITEESPSGLLGREEENGEWRWTEFSYCFLVYLLLLLFAEERASLYRLRDTTSNNDQVKAIYCICPSDSYILIKISCIWESTSIHPFLFHSKF